MKLTATSLETIDSPLAPVAVETITAMIRGRFTRPEITITAAAEKQQDELLVGLVAVNSIQTAAQLNDATSIGVQAQRFCKEAESSRLAMTKPLRDFNDEVNAMVKALVKPVMAEQSRVGQHIALFRQQEEERVRLAEIKRQKAIQAAEDAARAAAEALAAAEAKMDSEAGLAAAIAAEEAARAKEEAYRATVTTTPPEVSRSKGSAVRKEVRFEVLDIHAIYQSRPELCRIELNASACRAILTATSVVPGMKITEGVVGGFRVR